MKREAARLLLAAYHADLVTLERKVARAVDLLAADEVGTDEAIEGAITEVHGRVVQAITAACAGDKSLTWKRSPEADLTDIPKGR